MATLDTIVELGEMGLGAFGVGYVDDTVVIPIAERVVPGLGQNSTVFKAFDTASTAGLGWLAGRFGRVFSAPLGRALATGAYVLAGMKLISIFVPGAEVKTAYPNLGALLARTGQISAPPATTPPQLAAANGGSQAMLPTPSVPANYYFPAYGGSLNAGLNVGA